MMLLPQSRENAATPASTAHTTPDFSDGPVSSLGMGVGMGLDLLLTRMQAKYSLSSKHVQCSDLVYINLCSL